MTVIRKISKIIVIGVLIGILMLLLQNKLGWSDSLLMYYYKWTATIIILGAIAFNIVWQILFIKKVLGTAKLLEDGKVDDYIGENEAILDKTTNPMRQAMIKLNIAVGYGEKNNYRKALSIMEEININLVRGINRGVYINNLAYFLFKNNRDNEGLAILSKYDSELVKWQNTNLGPHIYFTNILAQVAQGDNDKAKEMLANVLETVKDKRILEDANELANELGVIK
ncbi:MAG: hypothetical protein GXZ11_04560 [Tissierellia bacterium]|nr:hypothetical protein [Tissierellia bacterium]